MARRSQPYRLRWPLTASQVEQIDEMFQLLFDDTHNGSITVRASQISLGILAVARGGTGIGTYTIGDILYADGAQSLDTLAGVATGNALISGGVATAPSWGKITLTTHVDGVLPVTNGGTNISSYTIGDLLYASGSTALSKLADVAAGAYLRSGGVATAPVWSSITLPNSAAVGDIWYASTTSAITALAGVSAGSYLRSGGVSTAPVWSTVKIPNTATQGDIWYSDASNSVIALAKSASATRYLANTGASNSPAWAQVDLTNGITGALPISHLSNGTFTKVTSTVTGSNNDLNIGVSGNTYCEWSGASAATITGITGGASGKMLVIVNTGSSVISFSHNSGSSSAANRFTNLITSDATPIAAKGYIIYLHNGTNWIYVSHQQGAWITPTFAAGDFTGNASMTWTVASGDVTTDRYLIEGTKVTYQFYYQNTTVGGTPSTDLRRAIPTLLTPKTAGEIVATWGRNLDNGTANDGFTYTFGTGGLYMFLRRDKTSGNWAAATDNTSIQGTHIWELV